MKRKLSEVYEEEPKLDEPTTQPTTPTQFWEEISVLIQNDLQGAYD
jgi:hypothetical protein